MAPGADKLIDYRVRGRAPGGLGLVDRSAKLLIRFDELETATRPQDETGVCGDFDVISTPVATVMPIKAISALGRGRTFNAATMGLGARDKDPGATLLTRDATVQIVMSWDAAAQNAAGIPGTIISRGVGGSSAEFVSYGLRLDVSDAPTFTALVRWYWQDVAGVVKLQTGAQVCIPPGQYTMLTATRRWVSPTHVELAYYVGDTLLAAVTSVDGSIGGGTTGLVQLGCRTIAGVNGAFLAGTLDELMVLDRELCAEEIEATWLRLTRYQPLATQLFRDQFDPDFPMAGEPDADQQLDIRMTGHALGLVASNAENLRAYFLPQRAYGSTLEQWEEATAVTPKPGATGSIEERRARVLARLRQKQGVSIPGLQEALRGLIGDATVDDLEFLAFSNTVTDHFASLDPLRWDGNTVGGWAGVAGTARSTPAAGTYTFDGTTQTWIYARMCVPADGREAHALAKVKMTTPQANLETGLFFGQVGLGNYLLFGLRDVAGVFTLVVERFRGNVSLGGAAAILGANPANLWLHIFDTPGSTAWQCEYSITSATTGFILVDSTAFADLDPQWTGMYVRTIGATAGAGQVDVDDFILYSPFGSSPFNAYVLLDQALGFSPDVLGAQSVVAAIKHAFTHATFITRRALLCDDAGSGCDLGPTGGY